MAVRELIVTWLYVDCVFFVYGMGNGLQGQLRQKKMGSRRRRSDYYKRGYGKLNFDHADQNTSPR